MRRNDRFKGASARLTGALYASSAAVLYHLRAPTVTVTPQPRETSRVDVVNFIQGYAEVYETLNSS
jgi:hypothetical protein